MKYLKISEIIIDEKYKTRELDKKRIKRIEEIIAIDPAKIAPILVVKIKDKYLLLDGHHRLSAWKRAYNGIDGDIPVEITTDSDGDKARMVQAVEPNLKQGNNYTIKELAALYRRLTKEFRFSRQEALKLLRISDERAQSWEKLEIIAMQKTQEEARPKEKPTKGERATSYEETTRKERAKAIEKPTENERAKPDETTILPERAKTAENSKNGERADIHAIQVHVERLSKLIPLTWIEAWTALNLLAEALYKKTREEGHE